MSAPGFAFDALKGVVTFKGQTLNLTPLRHRVLAAILANDNGADICDLMTLDVASLGALRVHIAHIRRVLPRGAKLANRYGCGYILTLQ